ncbi:hypothetical protein K438DRAFT_2113570 [Mycena galopus ATCC 62051]|nr:hypothetical protein K438DRAFT_2113570 [Mycena galopus ATCC 62051]
MPEVGLTMSDFHGQAGFCYIIPSIDGWYCWTTEGILKRSENQTYQKSPRRALYASHQAVQTRWIDFRGLAIRSGCGRSYLPTCADKIHMHVAPTGTSFPQHTVPPASVSEQNAELSWPSRKKLNDANACAAVRDRSWARSGRSSDDLREGMFWSKWHGFKPFDAMETRFKERLIQVTGFGRTTLWMVELSLDTNPIAGRSIPEITRCKGGNARCLQRRVVRRPSRGRDESWKLREPEQTQRTWTGTLKEWVGMIWDVLNSSLNPSQFITWGRDLGIRKDAFK